MRTEIKIVHICTSDKGGAATAALRLHQGLLSSGVLSSFLCLNKENAKQYANVNKFERSTKKKSLLEKIGRKIGLSTTTAEQNNKLIDPLKGQYENFSFLETDFRVEDHPLVIGADIINLHWISYFVNIPTFFKRVKQPIVWTMHDANPMLGGFHYEGDKLRNPSFNSVEESLKLKKRIAISHHQNLTIVTPSRWLGRLASADTAFSQRRIETIQYGLDTSVFKPIQQNFARDVFNLPLDKKIILFVTERLGNYRKGLDMLMEAVNGLGNRSDFVVVAIGAAGGAVQSDRIILLGNISDERLLSVAYSAADVFVLPSREDNFPNVMLESIACGTPVIAFATGGMVDVIRDGVNGILADKQSSESLKDVIEMVLDEKISFDRYLIRQDAERNFKLSVQAKKYKDLYSELLTSDMSTK